MLLSCQALTKSYSDRPLFQEITFGISEGEKVGLVGPNGSGKSTLLKILTGEERPDGGVVALRRGVRLGFVPQEDRFPAGHTVRHVLDEAARTLHLDEHECQDRIEAVLARCGFQDADQPAHALSGGWRKRLSLARELIREPDLLLLDEPTNHLDLEGILWLEELLRAAPFAYLVVSHDRSLLERAANRIIELCRAYAEGYLSVNGPYSTFLERRAEYLRVQSEQQRVMAAKVRKEQEWLGTTAAARSTKSGHRIREAGRLMDELAEVRFRNDQNRAADVDFTASRRRTRDLLVAHGVGKSLGGRPLFRQLDLILSPGTRLGLVGPNGSGKSTLLQVLIGATAPDEGRVVPATDLRIVYFDQQREQLDLGQTLRYALWPPGGDTVEYRDRPMHIVAWAKRFLFAPELLEMPIHVLSGGERARVLIARLMLQPADLLILDEPTNDLDIPTLEVLEESLLEFPGAMVLVTHDREMLTRVSTRVLGLDGRGGASFFADYSQWERAGAQADARTVAPQRTPPPLVTPAPPSAARLSLAELRDLSRMEQRIEVGEAKVAEWKARMEDPGVASDHIRLQECWRELQAAEERVVELYARWDELETRRAATGQRS